MLLQRGVELLSVRSMANLVCAWTTVLTLDQGPVSSAKDSHGDDVLFRADGETKNDPPGEAWIRIERQPPRPKGRSLLRAQVDQGKR